MKNPETYRLPLPWEHQPQPPSVADLIVMNLLTWFIVFYLGFQALRAFPVYQLQGLM